MLKFPKGWKLQNQDKLIDIITRTAQVDPPDDFAQSVIKRLKKEENAPVFRKILLEPHYVSLEMNTLFSGKLLPRGQIYLILLTGFFYLIAGVVLALGLRWMPETYLHEWIRNQAFAAFFSTGVFMLLWASLKRGNANFTFLRIVSFFYIAAVILNFKFTSSFFTVPLSVILSLFSMGLGLLTICLLVFGSAFRGKEYGFAGAP